jgi:hypothetical protein
MTTYLITYDLLKPGQDYKSLHDAIRSLDPSVWHGLESVWVLRSAQSAGQVRDYLIKFIDSNDRLLVIATSPAWSSWNLPDQVSLHGVTGTVPIAA